MPIQPTLSATDAIKVARRAGMFKEFGWKSTAVYILNALNGYSKNPAFFNYMNAVAFPEKEGLAWDSGSFTFKEANKQINQVSHGLVGMGIGPGDKVTIMCRNIPEMLIVVSAVYKINATPVTAGYRLTAPEVAFIAENSNSKVIVVQEDYTDIGLEVISKVDSIIESGLIIAQAKGEAPKGAQTYETLITGQPGCEPDMRKVHRTKEGENADAGIIIYTSGTTGKPKGAFRGASKFSPKVALGLLSLVPFKRSDRFLLPTPLYHSLALGMAAIATGLGATNVLMEKFDPEDVLRVIEKKRITVLIVVPTMINQILSLPNEVIAKYDLSSVRVILSSASHLPHIQRMKTMDIFGPVLYDLYGSTETGLVTIAKPLKMKEFPETIGEVIPSVNVALLDDSKKEVKSGEVGELFAVSGLMVDGYHNNKDATANSMFEEYFSVGDMAYANPEGLLFMADRKIDMVISGGINIYPKEIEEVLHHHESINDVAVIGIPDDTWGETLVALVVLEKGLSLSEDEVVDYSRKELAGYKVPRHWDFVDSLPRNQTGKVMKKELRAEYAEKICSETDAL